MALNLKRVDLD